MAEDSISELPQPASGRFQFRLRSIFVLMAMVAFAFGLVPVWYRTMIVPAFLPYCFTPDLSVEAEPLDQLYKEFSIKKANRYTPAFSTIAFVGCCGLWYACKRPTKRTSDIWLGLAFATSLGFVVAPQLGYLSYILSMLFLQTRIGIGFDFPFGMEKHSLQWVVAGFAALYSFWPLLLRRYQAALLLFIYRCIYGWIVMLYLTDIVSDTFD
jgi:hypothetical protein